MSSNEVKKNILSIYKRMIILSKAITNKTQKADILKQIRDQFRTNIDQNDPEKINKLIQDANSSLSYLRIISPKIRSEKQDGFTKIVFSNNNNENENKTIRKAVSNWTGKNMDPDSVSRHYAGLKRAGFKNNSHVKGGLF